MINLNLFRENTDFFKKKILEKEPKFEIEKFITLEKLYRALSQEIEALRAQKNEFSNKLNKQLLPKIDFNNALLKKESLDLKNKLIIKEAEFKIIEQEFKELYLGCPNIMFDDVPVGDKSCNKVVRSFGVHKNFNFEPKEHVELGTKLKWLDFEVAAAMTGSNFALFKGDAVKLQYSLAMMMLKNNIAAGFELISPPYLLNSKALEIAGVLPKFKDAVYKLENENLYLTPTAEINLTNMFVDKIFELEELPIRMTALTSCFRREAGTYGNNERGLIRLHQFEKVELFSIVTPENSEIELEKMIATAETILKKLDLHYRISLLATQDCSFQSAKTYDIEVWMPAKKVYYEVSSVSNCTDFQARRGQIRYRKKAGAKTEYVHMLNGSSLAFPRLIVALMENYQDENGVIHLPDVLKSEGLF